MCGRFTQHYTWQQVHEFLSVFGTARNLQPRYNIAPTTTVDVVRLDREGRRELISMRWGLVPFFWKKGLKKVPATFNARVDTLADNPMFREALQRRRCIIPASGFYERTGAKGDKQPHLFTAADGSPILALAGLWDRWRDPATKEEILSCTIIVTNASQWMMPFHDRMPVLLAAKDFDGWLTGTLPASALATASEDALREWPVSRRVSLSPCCRFHPAEVVVPCRSVFGTPCCLHPSVAGSALGTIRFRGHIHVYCRYGPVTRDPPEGDRVDRLQDFGFPPPCYPNYGAPDSCPGRSTSC